MKQRTSGASPSLKNWLDWPIYGNLWGRFHLPEVDSASLCLAVPWREVEQCGCLKGAAKANYLQIPSFLRLYLQNVHED